MTQNVILICDALIAGLGDKGVKKIDGMTGSGTINWENVMKVLSYKIIIRLHLLKKEPKEIASLTGQEYKQVTRIITRFNKGLLTA